jgi:sirohydrochlorin cobaltochelatase
MIYRAQHLLLVLTFMLITPLASWAGEAGHGPSAKDGREPAILLVTFGTSIPSAQAAFVNIEQQVRAAFPKSEIRWAYTSQIIRKKLAKEGKVLDSPEIALAKLMDEGYTRVVMQSLHMIPGAEFHEIYTNGKLFGQMVGGFDKVMVAYPLLSSDEAMEKTLQIMATTVVPKERQANDAVVLMGHGTHHPSDAIYSALMLKAQKMDANMYIGTVEGHPSFDEVKETLVKKGIKKAYLIPLMTVAGDHAMNDMAGDEPDSWKSQLTKAGIESVPVLKGLAEFNPIVDLWLENLKIAMKHVQ